MAEQNIDELRDSIVDFLDKALVELENPQAANLLDLQNRVERFLAGAYLDERWNDVLKIKRLPRPWSIRDEEYQKALKEFLKTVREQFTSGSLNPILEQVKPNTVSPEILKEQIRAHDEAKAAKQAYEAKWKNWYANYKRQLLQRFYAGLPPEEQALVNNKFEALNQYAGRVIQDYRAEAKNAAGKKLPKPKIEEYYSRNKVALRAYALSLGLPPSLADNKPGFLNTMRILEGLPESDLLVSPQENQIPQVAEVAGVLETNRSSLPPELAPHVDDNTISHLAVALVETGAPLGAKTETAPSRAEVFAQLENMAAFLAGSPLSPLQKAQLIAWVWDLPYPRKFFGLPSSQEIVTFLTKHYEVLAEKGRQVLQPALEPIRGFFLDLPGSVSGFFGGIFNSLFSVFNSRPAGALASGLTTAGNQLLPGLFSLAQNAGLRQRQAGFAAAVLKGTAETFFGKYKYYILGAALIFIFLFLTSSTFLTESAALLPPPGSTQYVSGRRGPIENFPEGCPAQMWPVATNNGQTYAVSQGPGGWATHGPALYTQPPNCPTEANPNQLCPYIEAIDIAPNPVGVVEPDDLILATHPGTAVMVGVDGYEGNYVVIQDNCGGNFRSMYVHMSVVSLTQGQSVNIGDQVGLMGATGRAGGNPHLHYEFLNANGSIKSQQDGPPYMTIPFIPKDVPVGCTGRGDCNVTVP